MAMKKFFAMLLSIVGIVISLAACGQNENVQASQIFEVYNIGKEETKVELNECALESTEPDEQLDELIEIMTQTPAKLEYKPVFDMGFTILSKKLSEGILTVNVDEGYTKLLPSTEVLVRAAIVRTFTQVDGIDYVALTVNGKPINDSLGNPVGMMSADMFIDNAGEEINALEKVKLKLYFADETGTALTAVNRTVVYNTNISLEKLVVEKLIEGPVDTSVGVYPTINPDTKIVSITVKDGICYVNLNDTFLTQLYNVTSDVTIYSIANSLVELSNINKVQITINGEENITYRENTSLTTIFERNLDLVTTP